MATYHGQRVAPGTTHYLSVSSDYSSKMHAVAAFIEGGTLMAPFCGVNSIRCNRRFGSEVTCPTCLRLIRKHQLTELAQPWPRCPRCWGHKLKCMTTPGVGGLGSLNGALASVCSYCAGTGIHPEPGQPCPPLPVVQAGVVVSKAGLGYAQCDGCHNHRPILHFAAWEEGAYCGACYARYKVAYRHYAPGQLSTWSAQNLRDIQVRHSV